MQDPEAQANSENNRLFFYGGKGLVGAVMNKNSVGGNWEFQELWLLIGWAVTVSPRLGCCQERKKHSFFLLSGRKIDESGVEREKGQESPLKRP